VKQLFHIILLSCLSFISVEAQTPDRVQSEAILKTDHLKIGEQTQLKLNIRYREGSQKSNVIWPVLEDTITYGVDILSQDTISTRLVDRASVLYEQSRNITITAFDAGTYLIPPIQFIVDQDTVQTDSLLLYVNTVPVDTTKPIKDIKDIYNVPPPPANADAGFNWWLLTAILVLVGGLIVLLIWLNKRKNKTIPPPVPKQPERIKYPHEEILEKLMNLQHNKPWRNGELKKYHVNLTDILRDWVYSRYSVQAHKMTTVEMMRVLQRQQVDRNSLYQLERIFRMADMVKFAKGIPGDDENEQSVMMAIQFVQATIQMPQYVQPIIQPRV
jgi:hypothetical protein